MKKTDRAHTLAARGRFPMKAVAQAMRVSRSHLVERIKAGEKPACCCYHKTDDAWLLPLIRKLTDCRMTYGYRRIGALLTAGFMAWASPLSITSGSTVSCARMACC